MSFDNKNLSSMYDDWKNNKITDEEYCLLIINRLNEVIKYLAIQEKKKYKKVENIFLEDLIQQGKLAIIEEFKKYDPYKTDMVYFFRPFIENNMDRLLAKGVHYEL